jgi:hypothetical protein
VSTRVGHRVSHRYLLSISLAIFAILASVPAQAQLLYGGLVGSVADAQGAVIPGATVKIVNTDTNLTRETVTDAQGTFTFVNVLAGPYDVRVTLSGFREAVRSRVPVSVGQISRVEMALEVGALNEVVTVQSEAQLLPTDKADVHTEIRSTEITNLPLNQYRNYQSTLMDGSRNLNVGLPHHTVIVPPAETIESVNFTTGSMDAEEGMAAGIAITVVTKSGTNNLKGSAFEFFNNEKFNATPYYFGRGATPTKLPIERQTLGER